MNKTAQALKRKDTKMENSPTIRDKAWWKWVEVVHEFQQMAHLVLDHYSLEGLQELERLGHRDIKFFWEISEDGVVEWRPNNFPHVTLIVRVTDERGSWKFSVGDHEDDDWRVFVEGPPLIEQYEENGEVVEEEYDYPLFPNLLEAVKEYFGDGGNGKHYIALGKVW